MHVVEFSTETPIQHLQRALDELARMGLGLIDLRVVPGSGRTEIRISFACPDPPRAENFRDRLIRLPGVLPCDGASARAEAAEPPCVEGGRRDSV